MKIAIIDYGAGNTQSVQFALDRIGCKSVLTADVSIIENADGVIFPGVGHATQAMIELKKSGLAKTIPRLKQPVLGICLGMQLMCSQSEEGATEGLGIFNCNVKRFTSNVKSPQVGWNSVYKMDSPLFNGIADEWCYYFVHSYYVPLNDDTIASADYDGKFSAALQKNNFYGCQFHPEKSSDAGERVLKNFLELCE